MGRPRTRALVCRVKKELGLKKDEFFEETKRDCLEIGGKVAVDEIVISIISTKIIRYFVVDYL